MGKRTVAWLAGLFILAGAVSAAVCCGGTAGAGQPEPGGGYVPGEVIVKFKPGVAKSRPEDVLSSGRLTIKSRNRALGFEVVKVPGGTSVAEAVAELSADPCVEYAEPNYIDVPADVPAAVPNDPLYPDQWHLHGFGEGGIDAQAAWDTERGDPSVIVAVVDTGVAYEDYDTYTRAPDLAGTAFVSPYDAVDLDGHPNDVDGHGTHVTGTIAQTTDNALGAAGAAHGCSIMPVRCLGPGAGTHAQMADAYVWATDHGAKIINYSAGGRDSQTKRDACLYAYTHGVTICAAYGNNNQKDPADYIYPAAYDDCVICVGATDRTKARAWYSNYGVHADVVGPGGDTRAGEAGGVWQQTYVTETDPASGFNYQGWQGTSMATPHVSATAALYISRTGISDPDAVRERLQATAHDLGGAGWDEYFGYGLVDADRMVSLSVTSITPGACHNGAPLEAAISGAGFLDGATVRLTKPGEKDIQGTGVTLVAPTRCECRFDLGAAAPGAWSVVVMNPDGVSGKLTDGLRVLPAENSEWYLAEGTTAWGFETYLSVINPGAAAVDARLTYNTIDGPVDGGVIHLPPASRATVYPRDTVGDVDFSTKVASVPPGRTIAVDRTMIWTGPGAAGPEAHSSIGATSPGTTWYFPEGSSAWGFECWLLVQNPGAVDATCLLTYMMEGAGPVTVEKTVPAGGRRSFDMSSEIGGADAGIAVTADMPVVCERAMYRNNRREGHESIGAREPARDYYLAEGSTAWGFTTYVLIQNPNDREAEVEVTYMTPIGEVRHPLNPIVMPPDSRKTIRVNDFVPGTDVSTRVSGSLPVIAERAMYWDSAAGEACHDSIGITSPHEMFYLPDGEGGAVETWTLVQNPNATPVKVVVTYLSPDGTSNRSFTATIPSGSRTTFSLDEAGVKERAGITVESGTAGAGIICERAMYIDGRAGGTSTIGGFSDD